MKTIADIAQIDRKILIYFLAARNYDRFTEALPGIVIDKVFDTVDIDGMKSTGKKHYQQNHYYYHSTITWLMLFITSY